MLSAESYVRKLPAAFNGTIEDTFGIAWTTFRACWGLDADLVGL